jgi:hypothetical protein
MIKFAAVAAAMAVLAGCAVSMPLPPFSTFSQYTRTGDLPCKVSSKCPKARLSYHHSEPIGRASIDADPPDFIQNTGDDAGAPRVRTQME